MQEGMVHRRGDTSSPASRISNDEPGILQRRARVARPQAPRLELEGASPDSRRSPQPRSRDSAIPRQPEEITQGRTGPVPWSTMGDRCYHRRAACRPLRPWRAVFSLPGSTGGREDERLVIKVLGDSASRAARRTDPGPGRRRLDDRRSRPRCR